MTLIFVPLGKIMLLTDATTELIFLRQTLDTCWRAAEGQSALAEPAGSLILLDTKGRDVLAVDTLMALADEALGRTASPPAPIGTASLAPAWATFAQPPKLPTASTYE